MTEFFTNINVDWMGKRKTLVVISIAILLAGLFSAIGRQLTPDGTDAFNLGVDFKGGTVVTAKFRQIPGDAELRNALSAKGLTDSVIQNSTDKKDEVLIKIPILTSADGEAQQSQVEAGRTKVKEALDTFGAEAGATSTLNDDANAAYKIVGTDSVGPVAGAQLRNQAVAATLLGLIGILLFIALRYDWTYAAGAVIAVVHDVLVTLAFFSIFQWEINLTVIASLLTLVGFSVNDSIVIFDRIRENLGFNRTSSIYQLTNDAINQTMSRTIITGGLVFLSVLALVLFGGEVLRASSLALFVGVITGTYSTIAIASPIAIWWQSKIGVAKVNPIQVQIKKEDKLASASRRSVKRRAV
jgi:preprotein translocase subunit SecF